VTTYTKPHLAFADQVGLLKSRGLIIDDEAEAEHLLSVIGYYRLSGYWYSYRRLDGANRADEFVEGTTFRQIVQLYDADRRLKLHVLDALERIEIGVRVMIGFTLGRRGAYGNGGALANWLRVLNYIRNVCAHHSRLWNRNLADQIAPSHLRSIPELRHLTDRQVSHFRIYSTLCVVAFLLAQIGQGPQWATRVGQLINR
jgi:abortive infection bacteriophage resistance protein